MTRNAMRDLQRAFFVVVCTFVGCVLLLLNASFLKGRRQYPIFYLRDFWTVADRSGIRENVSLQEAVNHLVSRGEEVTLVNRLPEETVPMPCVQLRTVRAVIDAYVDGEQIYSYGHEYLTNGKMMPAGYHYLPLPEDYAGKELKIVLSANVEEAFSGMNPVYVGNYEDIQSDWIERSRLALFTGVFLFTFAVAVLVLFVYMHRFHDRDQRILFSALTAAMLGLYILSYHGFVALVTGSQTFGIYCEYVALYSLPPLIGGFMMAIFEGRRARVFRVITILDWVMFAVVFLLNFLNLMHLNRFLPVYYAVVIPEGVMITAVIVERLYLQAKGRTETKGLYARFADFALAAGALALVLGAVLNMVLYLQRGYFRVHDKELGGLSLTMTGALIFMVSLFLYYFFYSIEYADEEILKQKLEALAYTDVLTELANRTRCEQVLAALDEDNASYAIFSLDINDLKQVNDQNGHAVGDQLLRGFARILRECFRDVDLIGRMGGDEFIVIMKDTPKQVCEEKMRQLYLRTKRYSRAERVFDYKVSYGYAHSSEEGAGSAREVYRLADERMYKNKQSYHAGATHA